MVAVLPTFGIRMVQQRKEKATPLLLLIRDEISTNGGRQRDIHVSVRSLTLRARDKRARLNINNT